LKSISLTLKTRMVRYSFVLIAVLNSDIQTRYMDNVQEEFTADKLRQLAESVKKQKGDAVSQLYDEIYEYVKSKYKELTQKEVMRCADSDRVKFRLPKHLTRKLKKLDRDSHCSITNRLENSMKRLGFTVRIIDTKWSCEYCSFQFLCNKMYTVLITWAT